MEKSLSFGDLSWEGRSGNFQIITFQSPAPITLYQMNSISPLILFHKLND